MKGWLRGQEWEDSEAHSPLSQQHSLLSRNEDGDKLLIWQRNWTRHRSYWCDCLLFFQFWAPDGTRDWKRRCIIDGISTAVLVGACLAAMAPLFLCFPQQTRRVPAAAETQVLVTLTAASAPFKSGQCDRSSRNNGHEAAAASDSLWCVLLDVFVFVTWFRTVYWTWAATVWLLLISYK